MKCPAHWLVVTVLGLTVAGCQRAESPRDHWYRRVHAGSLLAIPFSHDLGLLGFDGWQFLGKLPASLANAKEVEFSVWVEDEGLTDDPAGGDPPVIHRAGWQPGPDHPRRIDLDLLILRGFEDGRPVYRYRAVLNGSEITQPFATPEGYRQELSVSPPPGPAAIRPGQPIALGAATVSTWTRDEGEQIDYTLETRIYRWYLQVAPVMDP